MCICGHGFPEHEKILTKKKQSSKCTSCKCRTFAYIPTFPEEIGEYWVSNQKNFSYKTWKAKCKCKHASDEHSVDKGLGCKKCGCYSFVSNFCCAVCDKFWQDHENVYELEHERVMNKRPVGKEFIPFAEAPEIFTAVYNNKEKDNSMKKLGSNQVNMLKDK